MVSIDLQKYIESMFKTIQEDLDFCFENNEYNSARTHQVLTKVKVKIIQFSTLIDCLKLTNEEEKKYIDSFIELNKEIIKKVDWAYPNNNINEKIAIGSLLSISTAKNIQKTIFKIYEPETINKININIKDFFNKYELVYQDYLKNKMNDRVVMHYKTQILNQNMNSLSNLIESLTQDEFIEPYKKQIQYIEEDLKDIKKILNELYKNNNLINNIETINILYDRASQVFVKNIKRHIDVLLDINLENEIHINNIEVNNNVDEVKKTKIDIRKYL